MAGTTIRGTTIRVWYNNLYHIYAYGTVIWLYQMRTYCSYSKYYYGDGIWYEHATTIALAAIVI